MTDDRSTKPTSKIRILGPIAGACIAAIAITVLIYALTTPPSPEEVAESHIEDHFYEVAEAIVQTGFPHSRRSGNRCFTAEIAIAIAERVIPYRCNVNNDYETTVEARCNLSLSLDVGLEFRIYAPLQVTMAKTNRDFLRRTTPEVQDVNPIIDEITINGISPNKPVGKENKIQ